MKVIIVIAGLIFISCQVHARVIRDSPVRLTESEEACISELDLNRDDIIAVDMTKKLPEPDDFVSYMSCFAKKRGMVTANEFDYDKFKEEILNDARTDRKFSPTALRNYNQFLTAILSECHQAVDKENVGLTLIRTMDCVLEKVEKVKDAAD